MSAHDLSDEVLREISHKYIKHPLRAQAHVIFSAIAGVNNDDEAKKNHIIIAEGRFEHQPSWARIEY
jgi:hypothetical protein